MATNVFYSISPVTNIVDMKVSCDISISGGAGVATFSEAQTGNIGIGCHVISSNIDGFISEMTNSTTATIVTALGAAHGNVSLEALTSIKHEYDSLALAEAGFTDEDHTNNVDISTATGADIQANLCWYYDHDDFTVDSTLVDFFGTTTDATGFVNVFTPTGGTESINNQRHSGVWDDNKQVFDTGASTNFPIILTDDNIRITGIQLDQGADHASAFGIVANGAVARCYVVSCILKYTGGGSSKTAIEMADNGNSSHNFAINNIVDGFANGIFIRGPSSSAVAVIYNNTVVNCTSYGIRARSNFCVAKNNIVFNCVDGWLETDNFHTDSTNNMGDDATGPTNDGAYVQTSQSGAELFLDYSGEDFHGLDTSSDLYHAGADIDAGDTYYNVTDDIDGDSRHATTPSIGADEFENAPPGGRDVLKSPKNNFINNLITR